MFTILALPATAGPIASARGPSARSHVVEERAVADTCAVADLLPPNLSVHRSFLAALTEYQKEGRYLDVDRSAVARAEGFARYLEVVIGDARTESRRPTGNVPQTTLWWVEGDEFLGRLSIRHVLTDQLYRVSGHIGYDVRPSARRKGHATAMLAASLPVAAGLGIDPALVTCDFDNDASRRVIEANGGIAGRRIANKLRYWVATTDARR